MDVHVVAVVVSTKLIDYGPTRLEAGGESKHVGVYQGGVSHA